MKYLYCLVCGSKNLGGFPRGVGSAEVFSHAAKMCEWLQEIADMEAFRYRFSDPVRSQLVYGPTSAVPQTCPSEPTAADVHADITDIVRY
jgi:hypothetical protein